jgi:flavorubredoxin
MNRQIWLLSLANFTSISGHHRLALAHNNLGGIMATELYNQDNHICTVFSDLVTGQGVQSNQFFILDNGISAVIDPGGYLTYTPLTMAVNQYINLKDLNFLFASHQDPDIITSVDRWLMYTECKVAISTLWGRFVPHNVPNYRQSELENRFLLIPDEGMNIQLGNTIIKAIPAHFLHSVGNFQFYDTKSKILFSGDMGASVGEGDPSESVTDFAAHIPSMKGFHQRYMVSNKVCRLWANMVREMDIEMIVPQHGKAFIGKEMVTQFLDWISDLECGIDLMDQNSFQVPK